MAGIQNIMGISMPGRHQDCSDTWLPVYIFPSDTSGHP